MAAGDWMDSCQHYANPQMGDKWTFVTSPTLVAGASPRGTQVIKFQSSCSKTRPHFTLHRAVMPRKFSKHRSPTRAA